MVTGQCKSNGNLVLFFNKKRIFPDIKNFVVYYIYAAVSCTDNQVVQ